MSRQQRHHQQQQQLLTTQQQQQQALLMAEHAAAAEAAELFDLLCVATTMRQILALHRAMCDAVGLRPSPLNDFYPKLKAKVRSWKAQALWKKFDARAAHRVYGKANACAGTRVLVIGAGPCGLRTAIEAQLLGAKVVVLEKRDRITRNNVLHLWPFVITDLRNLGAKKFYGKFCAGSIDHISIRQLQCMLLKVALLLGVEIHEGVSFEHAIEPSGDGSGWKAAVTPTDHAVSHYEFDVLVGADGKRNMLDFRRKEFRGKLAIAITANFINKKTEAEAKVEEISGVAFIFNQAFFKELYGRTGIDLENIVYYKDETHYFVMTAKKHSLIDKGVIIEDMADPAELLAPANVDTQKLHDYAREAAEFSTKYQMLNLEFAVNHYGKPDVAMFDFTSMFAAEMSCRVLVRKGCRLLQCLVGDSLLEPFWPTGSGCARGFLSSMDAAYAIKLWANPQNSALGVLAQRESIYRLLNQTTPDTLQRDISAYTVDPATRYPNLNRESVNSWQVKHLIDTDDPAILEQTFMDTHALHAPHVETPGRRKRRSGDSLPQGATLLRWISAQLHAHRFVPELKEPSDIFRNGRVLCALINRYRPDLVDLAGVKDMSPLECNELAFGVLDRELHIDRVMTAKQSLELTDVESRVWLQYLDQICELFRGEIPHIKHPKMDFSDLRQKYRINHAHAQPDFSKLLHTKPKAKSPMQDAVDVPITVQRRSVLDDERVKRQRRHEQLMNTNVAGTNAASTGAGAIGTNVQQAQNETPRRSKKRRQADKSTNIEERQQRLKEIEENRQERMSKRRQARYHQTQNFYKSLQMLQAGNLLREGAAEDGTPFEDYSIFLYRQQAPVFNDRVKELERKLLFPDRERGDIPSAMPRNGADEQFSDRIKDMEQRMQGRGGLSSDKKPKDLMRAIGKIDSSDWNVREIEKKIEQSKKTEIHGPKGREKVPKWSKEQFQARQHKMSKPQRQDSREAEKFKEIDETLKVLDKQLKEGHNLDVGERGRNKVASIAGQFGKKDEPNSDEKNATSGNTNTNTTVIPKSSSKVALAFKKQAASEKCRFCKQTVYLMEKTTVEGLVLHRNCLKCHHCHTSLRMGGYAFDRDDPQGRFYCTQHFRLPPKPLPQRVNKARKSTTSQATPVATQPATVAPDTIEPMDTTVPADQVDVHQSSRTSGAPMSASGSVDAKSDDEAEIIDEHEWSGRNFLPESNNDSESDLSSSDESDTESESELFEEADDSPFGAQTLQLATDWIGKQNYENSDDSDDFYDSSEGIADDGKDDTEGEEFKKARELRREEVRLRPLPANLPTDTETEKLNVLENKENVEDVNKSTRSSLNSSKSFESAHSQPATPLAPGPTRVELEQLERNAPRKISSEIEAISEKLYHLNNMVKMNKDLEILAKENLVKSDILRKLTLKEKWLAENAAIAAKNQLPSPVSSTPKSKFDEKYEKVVSPLSSTLESKPKPIIDFNLDELKPRSPNFNESPKEVLKKSMPTSVLKQTQLSPKEERKSGQVSRSNSFKSNASSNSSRGSKLQIGNIAHQQSIESSDNPDYDVKSTRSSPLPNIRMSTKLKEIEATSFAGTMDHIKSQLVMPTVSAQAAPSVDLTKYFPNQKQEKCSAANINKNQKTLKDVDLAKYFPTSPAPQRRTVETVADRLKRSQTEQCVPPNKATTKSKTTPSKPAATQRQKSLEAFSLREHQLDGALDLSKKKTPVKETIIEPGGKKSSKDILTTKKAPIKASNTTTLAKASTTGKGKIKIVKKIVPKGNKTKKAAAGATKTIQKDTTVTVPPALEESERILNEILGDGEVRSPSSEYQKLFYGEKSPSDVSDKIERILEETGLGMELGLPRRDPNKKLQKTKSLGEGEFDLKPRSEAKFCKESGDRPSGVQNILKRFESMSSVKSGETESFKLRRMESNTSNLSSLNRSCESLASQSGDSMSDLEKTMDYLRNEWRNEATNFLQKKRNRFYAQQEEKKEKDMTQNTLPVQYRDSKIAKFFGVTTCKSQDKCKSQINKKKSPTKTVRAPKVNSSLEELAQISSSRQANREKKPHKVSDIISRSDNDLKPEMRVVEPVSPVPDDFEILDLLDKGTAAKQQLQSANTRAPAAEAVTANEPLPIKGTLLDPLPSRPVLEDIKNLPKTGCDKSLSNSRRSSQSSINTTRRLSDISLTEKLNQEALLALSCLENESAVEEKHVDELFQNMVEEMEEIQYSNDTGHPEEDLDDSLCTTISKSPSAQPVTVVKRGSSEEQSIENLFGNFTDEMLVQVEFDSNDELVGITPRVALTTTSSDRDYVEKLESLERDEVPTNSTFGHKCYDEEDETHFPSRPQRREKSSSSSCEPTGPIVPLRIKKKLAKLCPEDMPPSVQDLLQKVYVKNVKPQHIDVLPVKSEEALKFPRLNEDEDVVDHNINNPVLHLETGFNRIEQNQVEPVNNDVKVVENDKTVCSVPNIHTTSNISPSSQQNFNNVDHQILQETSLERGIEKITTSPMPIRVHPPNQPSKESSLEWDMEKMPNSPMLPRRRMTILTDSKLRDISPSSSIKLLNNLTDDNDAEATQRRLIAEFENERRQALVKRDESYEITATEQRRRDSIQSSSNSSGESKRRPPQSLTQKVTQQESRRNSDIEGPKRTGTPPMFKKLELPQTETNSTLDTTDSSTRRSSFAFIELQDNKPVIVPMPRKLKVPKAQPPKFVPEATANEKPLPAVFKDRPWPKPQIDGICADSGLEDEEQSHLQPALPDYARSDSPPLPVFNNRQWPDGKTKFEKDQRAEFEDTYDLKSPLIVQNQRGDVARKPRSQSPKTAQTLDPLKFSSRQTSKSYSDLKKGLSLHSLHSAHSSLDTDPQSTAMVPPRPSSYINYEESVDASTRALLDRGKRLHNRKRDFVNERVVERNPYMREVIRSERNEYEREDDSDLTSYRPRHYASNLSSAAISRFPTSRGSGRSSNYDCTLNSDYLSRRPYSTSATTTSNYYPSVTATRRSHISDLFKRRSPSSISSYDRRDYSLPSTKESCVQTESESTSPDEVELNSATEISTDSEFDNDEIIRQAPKIFIDDTHLKKPTKVQIKSTIITPNAQGAGIAHQKQIATREKGGSYLQKYQPQPALPQFKPLVQVDPTLLISSNRVPLQNPRPGDYLLNKTASTEGIASKKSLELKKRYLLGESANGNKIQKSGSTSVLDSRIRSFQSNISECQKLLNPSSDISAGMKSFLDRTKLGESARDELMRSATSNVINDLRVELKIQKAPSSTSTDNEKENVFVNSKNELNKGMEYSDAVNATLLEQLGKKSLPNTPTNNKTHIEVIDLVTPDKPVPIIDLTKVEIPTKMVESNVEFINSIKILSQEGDPAADSNKIIDLTGNTVTNPDTATKPDVSKDVKECIPDILGHIKADKQADGNEEEQEGLLCNSDEEKRDSPEKAAEQYEHDTVQIEVPNIPWSKSKSQVISTTTSGSSSSSGSSSIEDIQHYILDSTTSPDTHTTGTATGGKHTVPRLEVTDSSGALMQVDSLMIVDGKYIGDPEDVKYLDMPLGVVVPQMSLLKSTEVEEVEDHDADVEPITATPEPAERTVIEADRLPPLADMGPAKIKPSNLKFDTKNENKIESLKNLPLIVDSHNVEHTKAVKPITLNLSGVPRTPDTPTTPVAIQQHDSDKTPTAELQSRGSDSETERTGTGQVLTETELSDWTADDCISENFVDMEFVLNSNKGTIKRRKERKRLGTPKMPSSSEVINKMVRQAPVVKMDGILKSIDIDDIEFMDTGSEGSCAEAYSATNTALLHNRGYMEYIEAPPKLGQTSGGHNSGIETTGVVSDKCKPMLTKRDEKLGIDYIEQGAYIMHDDAKTPVNETPHLHPLTASVMTQSLTDSSTLNDLDEDSLGVGTSHSQTITKTQPTTTEESEALTVVTSPLDTSSPRVLDQFASLISAGKGSETAGCSTPSSSEKQPKTTQSTATTSSGSNTTSSVQGLKDVPVQNVQGEDLQFQFEYVRALQQRISQISTARDSLDSRKQRRKSSKGEPPNLQQQKTVIESTQSDAQIDNTTTAITRSRSSSTSNKVPEIPTLTSKLEEITKERTKQKDLIHDLVMDKLQSKKQLNAEKRLHRSRQRSLLTSGYASGSSLSPTPKLAAATTTHDANCTSQAHYHESTAEVHPTNVHSVVRTASPDNFKEPNSVQKSATYVSPYRTVRGPTRSADLYKPRPFSEHMDVEQICGLERYKLNKTPSFSHASVSKASEFATPVAPVRLQRAGNEKFQVQTTISASTENLRSEARARARLKSNSELGLSPEEKMQLLRKRLQYDPTSNIINAKQQVLPAEVEVEPNDLVVRVRKMSASKSVNDLAYMANQQHLQQQENDAVLKAKAADFISDPNLVASSEGKAAKAKSGRRQKDPERRKSLIQSLSSFFHKGNSATATPSHTNNKEQSNVAASSHSEAAERPGTSSSGTPTVSLNSDSGGGGGVFSRFRISPKSKEKSKSCFDLRSFGFGEKECLPSHTLTNNTPMPTTAAKTSQTKHSQDYLNNTNNSSCQKQTNNGRAVAAANAQAFSSSTPQLYIHKPHYLATANALDDQTPPPIPPLPLNYQRSDDESYATETREHKKQRAISKASRQAELKRLRIAQEIQREQEEIEVQLKELEARGVLIEKALRGEAQNFESLDMSKDNDEKLLKELLEIWRNITALKKRDEELGIRQQELQLEYRHAQLKEELNLRLSSNKLDKSSADVAAEGAILNEMLEIVAKRAALRPTASQLDLTTAGVAGGASTSTEAGITLTTRDQPHGREESNI
ncbi:F-actin-monooxygenase Mical isoform X2 [Scaptodrosophila lebanonensis]|uniref:F-actin monooxygenase n=1 Tax=Drosophila lebanonensis TaxID=7225 RepID=A0A6J2TK54_DROLE|nr:F-actin-monooxygenase Mical isoform X2 [Scaptodrosophila lebanonensis]